MIIEFPLRLPSLANARLHWAVKAKEVKRQREAFWAFWHVKPRPKIELPCVIVLTRIAQRSLDGDNLQMAFKAGRDTLAKEIGFDDRDERVQWVYKQEKGKDSVRIEITEIHKNYRPGKGR